MTKSQIKQELRRSACEDEMPSASCSDDAFSFQIKFRDNDGYGPIPIFDAEVQRAFFLLVAEAL